MVMMGECRSGKAVRNAYTSGSVSQRWSCGSLEDTSELLQAVGCLGQHTVDTGLGVGAGIDADEPLQVAHEDRELARRK